MTARFAVEERAARVGSGATSITLGVQSMVGKRTSGVSDFDAFLKCIVSNNADGFGGEEARRALLEDQSRFTVGSLAAYREVVVSVLSDALQLNQGI